MVRMATRKKRPPPIRLKIPFCFNFIRSIQFINDIYQAIPIRKPAQIDKFIDRPPGGYYDDYALAVGDRSLQLDMRKFNIYISILLACEKDLRFRSSLLILSMDISTTFAFTIKVEPGDLRYLGKSRWSVSIDIQSLLNETTGMWINPPHLLRKIFDSEKLFEESYASAVI